MPLRGEIAWVALDARDGSPIARIETERGKRYEVDPIQDIGPHNTWINKAGTRVYMEVLTVPYIYVADTATNKVLGKIGPFSKGIRPFAVTDDERYLYANVDGLLGFEIAEISRKPWGGRMIASRRGAHARRRGSPTFPSRRGEAAQHAEPRPQPDARIRRKCGWSTASTATSTSST